MTSRVDGLAAGFLAFALTFPSAATAQSVDRRPPAPPPAGHKGGLTPFRGSSLGQDALEGFALNQDECPLRVEDMQLRQDGLGVAVELRVANVAQAAVEDRLIWAWLVAPDGTIRGRQGVPGGGTIAAGTTENVRFTLRGLTPVRADAIVVAVKQATAGPHQCRRESADLDQEVKSAVRARR